MNGLLEWHRSRRYGRGMPDDLYDRDVLAWSEHQAMLLRRAARYGGSPALPAPKTRPVTLDALLSAPCRDLEAAFRTAGSHGQGPAAP
jgi:hypothetical protein